MKVLFIEPSGAGGIAHYTYALAESLAERGLEVEIVTGQRWNLEPASKNITIHPLFRGKKTNPWRLLRQIRQSKLKADVVHWQSTTHPELMLWLMRLLPLKSLPWVFTVHNVLPHEKKQSSVAIYQKIYRRMSGLIFHTQYSKREFQRIYPKMDIPHAVIPLGEYGFLHQAEKTVSTSCDPNKILFFGNIRHYKGLDILIHALAEVRQAIPNANLLIVGQALEDFQLYRQLIDELGLQNCVQTRLEYIPDEEIPTIMENAAVVALPYRHIDQSAVLLLALASGKPVVASQVGGLEEVVDHGRTGILVPPEDSHALARALISLLQDRDTMTAIGKAAAEDVKTRFSWAAIAEKTQSFYQTILG